MKNLILSVAALAVIMSSCDDNEGGTIGTGVKNLSITASIGAVTKAGEKSAWVDGDKLGVFVTDEQLGNPYNGDAKNSNIPFAFSALGWNSRRVTLDDRLAIVFAYYPFTESSSDGKAIPLETGTQTDYLYGTGSGSASALTTTSVDINMRHALTQVVFRMKKNGYTGGVGELTRVVISNNAASTVLKTTGTMNISTGVITGGTPGSVSLTAKHSILNTETSFSSIVMPVTATPGDDLRVAFTIDGKDFYHVFKAGTTWKSGFRNIYTFTLKDNDLIMGGDGGTGVTIEPWGNTAQGDIPLIPVI